MSTQTSSAAVVTAESLLREIVSDAGTIDFPSLRTARLKALPKSRRIAMEATLAALDALMLTLRERETAIALRPPTAPVEEPVAILPMTPALIERDRLAMANGTTQPIAQTDSDDTLESTARFPGPVIRRDTPTEALPPDDDRPTTILNAVTETDIRDALRATEGAVQPDVVERELSDDLAEMSTRGASKTVLDLPAVRPEDVAPEPEVTPIADDQPTPGWTRVAELLFDDALRLFKLGDSEGALVSLERLLAANELNSDLEEFVRVNEDRLVEVYQTLIGPWEKVPRRVAPIEPMPARFFENAKIARVLARVDGRTSIGRLLDEGGGMSRLEVAAVVSQLLRTKSISTADSVAA